MCMFVSKIEKKSPSSGKRKISIQKIIKYDTSKRSFRPPYRNGLDINGGWLRAEINHDFTELEVGDPVGQGIIHCYDLKKNLKNYNSDKTVVVNGFAYSEDYVCHGTGQELGFRKIWIPLEEIERATQLIKKRGYKT